jgi:stage II sporulation protein R
VRDSVLAEFEQDLVGSTNLLITRGFLAAQLKAIAAHVQEMVYEAGFDYPVAVEITKMFFPSVDYDGFVFPPGVYETLKITLGNGNGRNWWCLMFPPLCYVEMTGTAHTRNLLEQTVPAAGFQLLTYQDQANPTVAVRFRMVEWWQTRRQPATPEQHLQRAGR